MEAVYPRGYGLRMVSLHPLTDANRQAAEALRLAPGQERFVSDVAASVREAAEHPAAHAQCFVVYADDQPVGFVMLADEVDRPEYVPHFLWKLFIDADHQRRGFGTAALDRVVEWFRARPGVDAVTTSAVPGDGSPIAFYERYGFERTGEVVDGEVVLQLLL